MRDAVERARWAEKHTCGRWDRNESSGIWSAVVGVVLVRARSCAMRFVRLIGCRCFFSATGHPRIRRGTSRQVCCLSFTNYINYQTSINQTKIYWVWDKTNFEYVPSSLFSFFGPSLCFAARSRCPNGGSACTAYSTQLVPPAIARSALPVLSSCFEIRCHIKTN